MATISQLPAQLNFNSVAGNPATLVYNFTLTDSNGNPITWSDPRTEDGELMWPDRFGP